MSLENLELLKDDANYYGEFGKQFLSNSDIYALLNNPSSFKQHEYSLPMLEGSYFHMLMLQPELESDFVIVDASTRNTNIYKNAREESSAPILLLKHEADSVRFLADKMRSSMDVFWQVYEDGAEYEKPATKEIFGAMWKGKCDVENTSHVIDLKTTADISKFKRSAYMYNYDSQAWLYQEFFGKPMRFIVGCKDTHQIKIFDCSEEFLERGREKVMDAVIAWSKFFGPEAKEDPQTYVEKLIL
jgi:hypothetical protein